MIGFVFFVQRLFWRRVRRHAMSKNDGAKEDEFQHGQGAPPALHVLFPL